MFRSLLLASLLAAGLALIVAGAALVNIPAAVILLGLILVALTVQEMYP